MLAKLGQQPLLYQPGSTFEYSIATDVLGHLLERIEGKPWTGSCRSRFFSRSG